MAKSKWFFYKHYGSSFKIVLISKFLAHCATTYSMSSVILLSTLLELSDLIFFLKKPCDNSTIVKRSKNWSLFSNENTRGMLIREKLLQKSVNLEVDDLFYFMYKQRKYLCLEYMDG